MRRLHFCVLQVDTKVFESIGVKAKIAQNGGVTVLTSKLCAFYTLRENDWLFGADPAS